MPGKNRSCPVCRQVITPTPGMKPPVAALADAYNAHLRSVHPDFVLWEKSKLKYGATIGVGLALAVTVPVLYLGIFVFHLPSSFGRGLVILPALAFLLPIALINRRGARRFAEQWRNLHPTLPSQTIVETQNVSQLRQYSSEDDQLILQIARELTTQLGISGYSPESIVWQNMYPIGNSYNNVPSDQCILRGNTMYFAENMKDKLEPEDWLPLIASSLVYNKKIHRRVLAGILIRLAPIVGLYILGWFLIPPLFPITYSYNPNGTVAAYNNIGWEIMIFGGIALMIALIPIGLRWLSGLKLRSDREAAKIVGVAPFIMSLNKVAQVSPSDIASTTRRINNLETNT